MALGSVWKWSLAMSLATAPGLALAQGYNPYRADSGSYNTTADEDESLASDSTESEDSSSYTADEEEPTTKSPTVAQEPSDDAIGEVELIQERYPNRALKVEREVTQDAQGNYINHGSWKMYDEKGNLISQGTFKAGERHGVWTRWYKSGDADLFTKPPYSQFQTPFVSQATFKDGQLEGKWTIYDSKQRKVSDWEFVDGQRSGKSMWWFVDGNKMREIDYREGEIDGELKQWDTQKKLTINDKYQQGRKIASKTEYHANKQKKSEGLYLFAKDFVQSADDWWNAKLAVYTKQGKDERHGPWTSWYQSGQKQLEGNYEHDLQIGKFTWWHSNGQKALEGEYEQGKQNGRWVWWHKNGQKSIQGYFAAGNPNGRWTWWNEEGKVAQSADLSQSEGEVVDMPDLPKAEAIVEAEEPAKIEPRAARPQASAKRSPVNTRSNVVRPRSNGPTSSRNPYQR